MRTAGGRERARLHRAGGLGATALAVSLLLLSGCGGAAPTARSPQGPVATTSGARDAVPAVSAHPSDSGGSLSAVDADLDSVDQMLNQIDSNLADGDQARATNDDG